MSINKKRAFIANFNCTFNEDDEPMLKYFSRIIYPSIKESKFEENKDYFFESVKLIERESEIYLTGLIVKNTELEVLSKVIDGELIRTDEAHQSNPFSYFILNLRNHRLVLTKNQKGSPTLANFAKIFRYYIRKYLLENGMTNITYRLNVTAIPFKGKIIEELKDVKKISKVIFRFYPLNGDFTDNETTQKLLKGLENLGSKTGFLQYNTPKNINQVGEAIRDTKGILSPTLNVEYLDGSEATLKSDSFAERFSISINEDNEVYENQNHTIEKMKENIDFMETNEQHDKIYNENIDNIKKNFE